MLEIDGQDNALWYLFVVEGTASDAQTGTVDQRVIPGSEVSWLTENFAVISGFVKQGIDRYNVNGTIVDAYIGDGPHTLYWNGTNITGNVSSIISDIERIPELPNGGNGGGDDGNGNGGDDPIGDLIPNIPIPKLPAELEDINPLWIAAGGLGAGAGLFGDDILDAIDGAMK